MIKGAACAADPLNLVPQGGQKNTKKNDAKKGEQKWRHGARK